MKQTKIQRVQRVWDLIHLGAKEKELPTKCPWKLCKSF